MFVGDRTSIRDQALAPNTSPVGLILSHILVFFVADVIVAVSVIVAVNLTATMTVAVTDFCLDLIRHRIWEFSVTATVAVAVRFTATATITSATELTQFALG